MSRDVIETAGLIYGVHYPDSDSHTPFTELRDAKLHMIALSLRGVQSTLMKCEVHTRVSWTPWAQLGDDE